MPRAGAAGVDITSLRLRLPLPLLVALLISVVGAVFGFGLSWANTTGHVDDREVHVDAQAARAGGGLAYQRDIWEEHARIRVLLKSMVIECKSSAEGMRCRVDLPETPAP
jgi:hypothetical protein